MQNSPEMPGLLDDGWVPVEPDSIGRCCDQAHESNVGGIHIQGFCRACAYTRELFMVLTAEQLRDVLAEFHPPESDERIAPPER